jgi:hypothetical protein
MVTFIDILGFGHLIQGTRKDSDKVADVASLLVKLKKQTEAGGRIHRENGGTPQQIFHSFNFSDLTVRCTEIPSGANLSDFLNWELLYIGELQLGFLLEGILLRGGICLGETFIDEGNKIIFGPGLVKAYKLESEYAVYPRIVIDRDYLAAIDNLGGKYWPDYVRQGDDGAYFVDYLFGSLADSAGQLASSMLAGHRDAIRAAIDDGIRDKDARLRQKYMWLALYHNSTVERLSKRFFKSSVGPDKFEQYRIPKSVLNF